MKCPVCNKKNKSMLCPECGFDSSRDYGRYPTFGIVGKVPAVSALRKEREVSSVSCADSSYQEANGTDVPPQDITKDRIPDLSWLSVGVMWLELLSILLPALLSLDLYFYLIFSCIVYAIDLAIIISMAVKSHSGKWHVKDDSNKFWLSLDWAFMGWLQIGLLTEASSLPIWIRIAGVTAFCIRPPLTSGLVNTGDSTSKKINLSKMSKVFIYYVLFMLAASTLLFLTRLVGLVDKNSVIPFFPGF